MSKRNKLKYPSFEDFIYRNTRLSLDKFLEFANLSHIDLYNKNELSTTPRIIIELNTKKYLYELESPQCIISSALTWTKMRFPFIHVDDIYSYWNLLSIKWATYYNKLSKKNQRKIRIRNRYRCRKNKYEIGLSSPEGSEDQL